MINNWVCLDDDYVFAEWIFKVEFINLLEMQIFTRELLISGQETKQLIITHPLHDNEEEAIQYYLKCLFTVYEQKKIYYFFEVGKINQLLNEQFSIDYCLEVYNENKQITSIKTNNIGCILTDINPQDPYGTNTEGYSPFLLNSTPISSSNNLNTTIYLKIKSNIYFPIISNSLETSRKIYPYLEYLDNLELSKLNQEKFNLLFKKIINLVKTYNGSIEFSPSYSLIKHYKDYTSLEGFIQK